MHRNSFKFDITAVTEDAKQLPDDHRARLLDWIITVSRNPNHSDVYGVGYVYLVPMHRDYNPQRPPVTPAETARAAGGPAHAHLAFTAAWNDSETGIDLYMVATGLAGRKRRRTPHVRGRPGPDQQADARRQEGHSVAPPRRDPRLPLTPSARHKERH